MAVFKNGLFINYNGEIITPVNNIAAAVPTNNFFQSTGITNQQQRYAIYNLVADLQNYGIWDKMKAIYPMVGQAGVSSSFQFNLKDPSTFKGIFSGSWTFSSTGATPDGSTGYMDTGLNDNTSLNLNDVHFSVYLRTDSNGTKVDLGVFNGNSSGINIFARLSNLQYTRLHDEDTNTVATTDSRGFRLGVRNTSTTKNVFINNTKTAFTQNSVSKVNGNIYLGALNDLLLGGARFFSDRQNAFSSIGDGLTDTEASNLYTAVQRFQTTLGRQV
jgi:hypothetical protein